MIMQNQKSQAFQASLSLTKTPSRYSDSTQHIKADKQAASKLLMHLMNRTSEANAYA
jgi:hypothetical protein